MAQGRCAGCGKTGQSCRGMKQHILACPDYLALWKKSPAAALEPEAEFERWKAEEDNPEARAEKKDVRLTKRFAALDEKRTAQVGRWATPPDPLDD